MKREIFWTGVSSALALTLTWLVRKRQLQLAQQAAQPAEPMPRNVLIIGATSAIAQATARLFAAAGDNMFLVGRNLANLNAIAADLKVRGAGRIQLNVSDLNDLEAHPQLLADAATAFGELDVVLIAYGTLSDQQACRQSFPLTEQELKTNFLSVVSLLTHLANRFELQRHGTIAVISSVAGDRGRFSNYVYGTAKAGVSTFLQGLRARLDRAGVTVITIKPGFVDTPMTDHLDKGPLFVSPEVIAAGIYRAILTKQDVVYLPWFWWGVMTAIRHIPERFFKKLSI